MVLCPRERPVGMETNLDKRIRDLEANDSVPELVGMMPIGL